MLRSWMQMTWFAATKGPMLQSLNNMPYDAQGRTN